MLNDPNDPNESPMLSQQQIVDLNIRYPENDIILITRIRSYLQPPLGPVNITGVQIKEPNKSHPTSLFWNPIEMKWEEFTPPPF